MPPPPPCFCPTDCDSDQLAFKEHPDKHRILPLQHYINLESEDLVSSFEGSGSISEDVISHQRSLEQTKSTKSIKDDIDRLNKKLYPNITTTSISQNIDRINKNHIDKDGNICYSHCECCNKQEEQTIIQR